MNLYIAIALFISLLSISLAWWSIRSSGYKVGWKLKLSQICLAVSQIILFSWLIGSGQVQGMFFVLCAVLVIVFSAGLIFWSYQLVNPKSSTRKSFN